MAFALHFRRKVTQIMQNVSLRFDFLREKISTTALRRFFALRRWCNQMMMGGMEGKKQRRAMHAAVCNIDVKKLVFEVDNKVELVELLLVERSRSVEHNVATAVVFRERDAVAD